MNNNDDTFIREVNEELRSEQLQTAWKRFRPAIIGLAVLIVAGVAGASVYEWWQARESSASGDRFLSAIKDANDKKSEQAVKELETLVKDGFGSYPVLARMRLATLKAEQGDAKGAIADFLALGQDAGVPQAMRNAAKMRAGWLMVDQASYAEIAGQVEELAAPTSPVRFSAREILGLAAYKAGDYAKAKDWMQKIVDDNDAPAGARTRARMVLGMITASGKLS
ncbi:MAG: tetratricopeptide repeat protein [Rhizobiaceae bacterium]|nr:tetratricopeptide repeat protein [Rhizobiaceae bacterium]